MNPITPAQIALLKKISQHQLEADEIYNKADLQYLVKAGLVIEQVGRHDFVKQAMQPWKPLVPPSVYNITRIGRQVIYNAWR